MLEISPAKLSRLETGQVTPKVRDVRDLLEQYDAPEPVRQKIMDWTNDAKDPGWWHPVSANVPGDLSLYISLEVEAASIRIFSYCIPALLETRDYASMVLQGLAPQRTEEQHRELLNIRMKRQDILDQGDGDVLPVELHVILDEGALQRAFYPPQPPGEDSTDEAAKQREQVKQLMTDQLEDLAARSERKNITVQVFPYSAGYSQAQSLFTIFEPRDKTTDSPVVCVESTGRDAYYEGEAELTKYCGIWQDLERRALSIEQSRARVRSAAELWRQDRLPA